MNKNVPKLNLELREGMILYTDMAALKKFLLELSREDLIDIHNLTVELINNRLESLSKK